MWYVYVLECNDSSFYTGVTADYNIRLAKHNDGKASVYTKKRRPVRLRYIEQFKAKSEAAKRESQVKRLTVEEKEALLREGRGKKFL